MTTIQGRHMHINGDLSSTRDISCTTVLRAAVRILILCISTLITAKALSTVAPFVAEDPTVVTVSIKSLTVWIICPELISRVTVVISMGLVIPIPISNPVISGILTILISLSILVISSLKGLDFLRMGVRGGSVEVSYALLNIS